MLTKTKTRKGYKDVKEEFTLETQTAGKYGKIPPIRKTAVATDYAEKKKFYIVEKYVTREERVGTKKPVSERRRIIVYYMIKYDEINLPEEIFEIHSDGKIYKMIKDNTRKSSGAGARVITYIDSKLFEKLWRKEEGKVATGLEKILLN